MKTHKSLPLSRKVPTFQHPNPSPKIPVNRPEISGMTTNPPDGYAADDFLEQILSIPSYTGLAGADSGNSSETASLNHGVSQLGSAAAVGSGLHHHTLFPLGLSLDNGHEAEREAVNNNIGSLYPAFDHLQGHAIRHPMPHVQQTFQGQLTPSTAVTVPHAPGIRPRVRARRGQATDPHSIAERLRRERISERIKALQELVPSCNKTDRAAMLDEILDYVKFLRLQVKVLSMSRLGGAGAVAPLVTDIPLQSMEGETSEIGSNQHVWEKWSNEETENEVAKLMEEDVGAAMQFLQSKSLCIMPISLAALIYPSNQSDDSTLVKPEPPAPS